MVEFLAKSPVVSPRTPVALTPERLWFLYLALDLIKVQVETITGWTRSQINQAIRKHDLGNFSSVALYRAKDALPEIARELGLKPEAYGSPDELRAELRRIVIESHQNGTLDWDGIDKVAAMAARYC